jgi:MFS family permease
MMDGTMLTDASGGWLASFNYLGYMCGALITASISNLQLKDTLYRIGLVGAVVTTVAMGLAENIWLWAIMRFLAGLCSATGLLIGSGLILNWMLRHNQRAELGLHFSGIGVGIAVSAIVAILMLDHFNWSQQWYIFAALGVVLLIPAWYWLPRPKDGVGSTTQGGEVLEDKPPPRNWLWILFAAYFCAGFGYVISATFLVTIVDSQPSLQGNGGMVWLITGLAATPACIFWDRIARRTGQLKALLLAYAIQIVGIILPALDASLSTIMISGALYGATFIGIVSLMLTMAGRFFPTRPAKPMGKLTLSYGAAQVVAPAVSGMMAEATGNYNGPLFIASAVMLVGMVLLLILQMSATKID